jgi:hypothetical protein
VKPHGFHREAEAEYIQAAIEYAAVSPKLGGRFYDEIERLIAEVCRRPEMYRYIRHPIRRHFSMIFPFGILYEDKPDVVRSSRRAPMSGVGLAESGSRRRIR